MRFLGLSVAALGLAVLVQSQDLGRRAWDLESKGDALAAQELLQRAAQGTSDAQAWRAYAVFLDRHDDPGAREAYEKALSFLPADDRPGRAAVAGRLAALDLLAEDRDAAARALQEYSRSAGRQLTVPGEKPAPAQPPAFIEIPGPLRSFARMAALAPDLNPQDLLPALARNVVTNGYQALSSSEGLDQTEYLKLVIRYLSQARELDKIAGKDRVIRLDSCESSNTADLLRVLGYRMRGGCGSDVVLETVNATRAFLTIDSGFPLADLEQALRSNRPFTYNFQPSRIPVLYSPDFWLSAREKSQGDFIDVFLGDPSICRLYLAMAKMDPVVADALRENSTVLKLKAFAHVLDFYGGLFEVRNGRAVTPGGPSTEKAWADLTGAPVDKPAQFYERLVSRDDGWMASYYDALMRVRGPAVEYLTQPERMRRFYLAIRGKVTSPGPARPVFRANTDMMLLTTRLVIGHDGRPIVPGNLDVWKNLFVHHPNGKYDAKLTKAASGWKDTDDLLEALFALCRKAVDNEPLKIYMAMSDLERGRAHPLKPATVDRLVRAYRTYGAQYSLFAETPNVNDQTILAFVDTADSLSDIKDQAVRSDAVGICQALVSMWQIFVRQGSIPSQQADAALQDTIKPFDSIRKERDLFDAGRASLRVLLTAAKAPKDGNVQDATMDLLAGAGIGADSEAHTQVIQDMIRIFEAQRLISLQSLFDLADNLERAASGEKINNELLNKVAARMSEIQGPRSSMTAVEKNQLGYGYWTDKHIERQRRLNLKAAVDKAGTDAEKLRDVRGELAPFLRDTLVGLNYVHYAPPGAQVLYTNPVFVRSHDFVGFAGSGQTWKRTEVFGSGWPANAGGRLVGSLVGLPYALAEAEQNFLIPSREQALIWGDLVPQMLISSKIPRWWNVTPAQVHWVGLHMNYGESLIAESAFDAELRGQVLESLSRHAPPARVRRVSQALSEGHPRRALDEVTPSELYAIGSAFAAKAKDSPDAAEIQRLAREYPDQVSPAAIARCFGTPKPTLSNSYAPDLLDLPTFPTLMGYSSRIMAETWESSLLYYAALADEIHAQPAQLNLLIPEWTQLTVERIFATHLEDWPALLRSLRTVGDEVRQKARKQQATAAAGAGSQ
jgi:hypothetical protein